MITLPPEPSGGTNILTWAREVQKCLRRLRLTPGPGIRISEGANSTAISADPKSGGKPVTPPRPFELRVETDPADTSENPPPKIRVYPSTLGGGSSEDLGFSLGDDPPFLLTPVEGVLQGRITINNQGDVASRHVELVTQLGEDTDTTYHVEIGTVASGDSPDQWIVSNSRFGPIGAQICRNWYAASEPFYGLTWL